MPNVSKDNDFNPAVTRIIMGYNPEDLGSLQFIFSVFLVLFFEEMAKTEASVTLRSGRVSKAPARFVSSSERKPAPAKRKPVAARKAGKNVKKTTGAPKKAVAKKTASKPAKAAPKKKTTPASAAKKKAAK